MNTVGLSNILRCRNLCHRGNRDYHERTRTQVTPGPYSSPTNPEPVEQNAFKRSDPLLLRGSEDQNRDQWTIYWNPLLYNKGPTTKEQTFIPPT